MIIDHAIDSKIVIDNYLIFLLQWKILEEYLVRAEITLA